MVFAPRVKAKVKDTMSRRALYTSILAQKSFLPGSAASLAIRGVASRAARGAAIHARIMKKK
jgi:hypothetical protein